MAATLRVTREQGFGIELRRGTFEIVVDGERAGSIEDHKSIEVPVPPGGHTLRMRKGRYSSRTLSFDVADGDTAIFQCHGIRIWPMWVASTFVPSLAIALRPE
jgi:hypothetical protein